jgi:HSP20 family protein
MNMLMKPEFPLLRKLSRDLETFFDGLTETSIPGFFETNAFWAPDVEVFERGNEFVVRADVPGLKKEEITIELTDEEIMLKGERKQEKEEKADKFYRSERTYGSFYRAVPLPEGVKIDKATAVVKDGVLEVKIPLLKVEPKKVCLEIQGLPVGEKKALPAEKGAKHAA